MMSKKEVAEMINADSRRYYLRLYHIINVLNEELGTEKAKELVSKAIQAWGMERGRKIAEKVKAKGLELTPENMKKYSDISGPWSKEIKKPCRIYAVLNEKGIAAEWMDTKSCGPPGFCDAVDFSKYKGFNPKFKIVRTKWILRGDDECHYEATLPENEEEQGKIIQYLPSEDK